VTAAIPLLLLAFAACDSRQLTQPDQCLRARLFKECLAAVPTGPTHVKYNDWEEIVSTCGSQAYYQSLRVNAAISAECRIQP
jgi:hypothetical protein